MPIFISTSSAADLAKLALFVKSHQGTELFPGAYLLPWEGTPESLPPLIRRLVPLSAKVAIAAVTDYWALVG